MRNEWFSASGNVSSNVLATVCSVVLILNLVSLEVNDLS
jgi:hypothetical protein